MHLYKSQKQWIFLEKIAAQDKIDRANATMEGSFD